MAMLKKLTFLSVIVLVYASTLFGAEIKNEVVKQVGKKVIFEFDVISSKKEVIVSLDLNINDRRYSSKKLSLRGDIGKIRPGKGKNIYWEVLKDFPKGISGEVKWNLEAGDIRKKIDEMVLVKGGCYEMGDSFDGRFNDNKPVHEVCVNSFYIRKYEVTVDEFRKFVDNTGYTTDAEKAGDCFYHAGDNWEISNKMNWKHPGYNTTDEHPVACVSWNDAMAYIAWLSKNFGKKYRLPTEAEWEYAARSRGMKEKWPDTNRISDLRKFAWYDKNSGKKAHNVGQKRNNRLGLHDMCGNAWEWVADKYDANYYKNSQKQNPLGPASGMFNVLRGGSWIDTADDIHVTRRMKSLPDFSSSNFGFRYVMSK
jgi:sulfatase modifying factor 1